MHVFVLDPHKKPLSPCHPAKARRLLKSGRASVFRCYPFTIILHAPKAKSFQGFQTGDIVRATIPKGKFAGNYVGRIAIRFRPSFRLKAGDKPFDVHPKYLTVVHHSDGYEYAL